MKLEEVIERAKYIAAKKYCEAMIHRVNSNNEKYDECVEWAEEHYQLADWLEELKELRKYKEKYRWHDLRKNPDNLPDVEHRRKAYFYVVQAGKEARPAILQYKKDFGFGIYNEFGNGPKFTGIDTDLIAPVVAWKEIEEFESEGEDED